MGPRGTSGASGPPTGVKGGGPALRTCPGARLQGRAGSGNSRVGGRGGVHQIRGDARVESAIGTLNANPVLRRLRRDASALYAKLEG